MNAFSSLEEKKKKELLMNAKLKDELALQSIGITNLSARLTRQTEMSESVRGEISAAEKKAKSLRIKLASLRMDDHERVESFK